MPIKYQMLGGASGNALLILQTLPNAKVTLTMRSDIRTETADASGRATFKGMKVGTYTVTIVCSNGETYNSEVVVTGQCEDVRKKINEIPIGSKLKFSSGLKMILMNKELPGHDPNSAQFVSEYVTETYKWDTPNIYKYGESKIHTQIMLRYYNELTAKEKEAVIHRTFMYDLYEEGRNNKWYEYEVSSYFYSLSGRELNTTSGTSGNNFGFTDDASRIKTLEDGTVSNYYTSSFKSYNWDYAEIYNISAYTIDTKGHVQDSKVSEKKSMAGDYYLIDFTAGVLPACDLKGDTLVLKGSDGYWRIVEQ